MRVIAIYGRGMGRVEGEGGFGKRKKEKEVMQYLELCINSKFILFVKKSDLLLVKSAKKIIRYNVSKKLKT